MHNFLLVALLFSSIEILACPSIVGTWRSSKELSVEYNTQHLDLEPHTIKFIKDVYGILLVTYTKTTIRMHGAPTIKIKIKDKEHDFAFEESTSFYKLVSCTDKSIKILIDSPYSSGEKTMVFTDPNTFWVPAMPGSNIREYFKLVQ